MTDLSPFPIPRELRQTDVLVGNGGTVYGPFSFKCFDTIDVKAYVRRAGEKAFTEETIIVQKVSGAPLDHFTVTFSSAVSDLDRYVVTGQRLPERSAGVKRGGRIDPTALEKELSKIAVVGQELRRDIGRAVVVDYGSAPLKIAGDIEEGQSLVRKGNMLVGGSSAEGIDGVLGEVTEILEEVQTLRDDVRWSIEHGVGLKLNGTTSVGVTDYEFASFVPVGSAASIELYVAGGRYIPGEMFEIIAMGVNNGVRLVSEPGGVYRIVAYGALIFTEGGGGGGGECCECDCEGGGGGTEGRSIDDAVAVYPSGRAETTVNRAKYVTHMQDFAIDLTGTVDTTTEVQRWLNEAAKTGVAQAARGKILVSRTLIVPAGVTVRGMGRKDEWGDNFEMVANPKGTVFITTGGGNPARWTDITGSDPADDTPMFVAAGNNVYFEDLTVWTPRTGASWSVGFFFPCVRQCGVTRVNGFYFTDAALYLDGTWYADNYTLKALHPEIAPSTAMAEFLADDCFLNGGGTSGFAYKIQGTTRAYMNQTWLWGTGGVGSDCRMSNSRLGSSAPNGGCFAHDAQLAGANAYGRGVYFDGVGFRSTGGSRYWMKLDRSEGITLNGCYAEGKSDTANELAVTSRTKLGAQKILIVNDRAISGDVTVDGVIVSTTSERHWDETRCITWTNTRGLISTPNFNAGPSAGFNNIPEIASYYANGRVSFKYDDGGSRAEYLQIRSDGIRPVADNTMPLGHSGGRFTTVYAATGAINTSDIREKQVMGHLIDDDRLMRVAARLARQTIAYKWKSAIAEKGDGARVHFGIGAQYISDAFEAEGLDPKHYAVWCKDYVYDEIIVKDESGENIETRVPRRDENGNHVYTLGIRDNILSYLMSAYYVKRCEEMEARLARLEN